MRYRDMIPGSQKATDLVETGKQFAVQKGKDVAKWGAHRAIDAVVSGVRVAMHVLGFTFMAAPIFQNFNPVGKK